MLDVQEVLQGDGSDVIVYALVSSPSPFICCSEEPPSCCVTPSVF